MKTESLLSWGRYPRLPQTAIHPPQWKNERTEAIRSIFTRQESTLPFGNGRSYGDVCLARSSEVISGRGLNRFIEADWASGLLTAECGVTLQEILEISIPRGWFPAVTPGTQFVTLGGAIANDVHGKNHHVRGCFGQHVKAFGLVRSDHEGEITCTPDEKQELYCATIGGLGLTGMITWAQIELIPIASSQIVGVTRRFENLEEFLEISTELDPQHEFSVSWVDCTASGARLGRGIYNAGNFAKNGPLQATPPARLAFPCTSPVSLVNNVSVRAFNAAYWRRAPKNYDKDWQQGYQAFFYPLDGIADWNRAYGPEGFQQFQCVIPENDAHSAISELLQTAQREKQGSFLAVLKRCGDMASPGLLSFPLPGITLALDFAQAGRPEKTLFPALDAIVRSAGGRLYPAKDAHMRGEDFRNAYPQWQRLESLRDPALMSRFWQRVSQ